MMSRPAIGSQARAPQPEPCTEVVASVSWALKSSKLPKRLVDGRGQLALGLAPAVRAHAGPEDAVQDVAGEVEGEVLAELGDEGEVAAVPGVGQLLEGGVRPLHVGGVVLVVVELHDPSVDVRLEGRVVVRQVGEGVGAHRGPVYPDRVVIRRSRARPSRRSMTTTSSQRPSCGPPPARCPRSRSRPARAGRSRRRGRPTIRAIMAWKPWAVAVATSSSSRARPTPPDRAGHGRRRPSPRRSCCRPVARGRATARRSPGSSPSSSSATSTA